MREVYVNDTNTATREVQDRDIVIQEQRRENDVLRQILAANGISFENELESRKINMGMPIKKDMSSSLSPNPMATRPHPYSNVVTAPSSTKGYSPMRDIPYSNGNPLSVGHSPGTTHHSGSPSGPDVQEHALIKQEPRGVPDMPIGIFEKDPQLGIDFILQ